MADDLGLNPFHIGNDPRNWEHLACGRHLILAQIQDTCQVEQEINLFCVASKEHSQD